MKTKGISLDSILEKNLKIDEFKIYYSQSKFYLQIARLIRDLREKTGWSQERLAKAAKVSQPLIARLEKGDQRRIPTFDTIYRVLRVLGYELAIQVKPIKKVA